MQVDSMKEKADNIELLIGLVRGQLPGPEEKRIEAALKADRDLAELYSVIKELHAEAKGLNWPQIGGAVKEISSRLFEDYSKSKRRPKARYGVALFDSKLLPLPEGVRPAAVDTRRIKYRFDDYILDVSLYPVSPESYEVIGQISAPEEGSLFEVSLKSRGVRLVARTDAFQLFRFERVPATAYELSLKSGKRRIGTVDIEL